MGKSALAPGSGRDRPGHPHAGGEIPPSDLGLEVAGGPSPRGWGNQRSPALVTALERAIPTRVGKSKVTRPPWALSSGHPHAGGEILVAASDSSPVDGPSPRGWGNLGCLAGLAGLARAIPTRVGKSVPTAGHGRRCAGHPHAGGEISSANVPAAAISGPSPRGWGNPGCFDEPACVLRAIPTRVGKSDPLEFHPSASTGHPHAGGEIGNIISEPGQRDGPSPRGWGNHEVPPAAAEVDRAIPTRVGKSYGVS